MKRNEEIWKPINGYSEYYIISNFGRIRSFHFKNVLLGKILKPAPNTKGYLAINLVNKKSKIILTPIHLLVLSHFVGPKPSLKHQGHHKDTNKRNNWYTNLEWLLDSDHSKLISGELKSNPGEKNGRARMTQDQVLKMRKLYSTGKYSLHLLANKFKLSKGGVYGIVTRRTWSKI